MQFPKSMHAEGWRDRMPAMRRLGDIPIVSRDADATSPSLRGRRLHIALLIAAVAALGASAGLNAIHDPRPLDEQLSTAMQKAGDTLAHWQQQLSRGLQVSLRAVADGRELPPVAAATPR